MEPRKALGSSSKCGRASKGSWFLLGCNRAPFGLGWCDYGVVLPWVPMLRDDEIVYCSPSKVLINTCYRNEVVVRYPKQEFEDDPFMDYHEDQNVSMPTKMPFGDSLDSLPYPIA
ncbi:hypothetical protein BHM03_00015166 [Ensete ventricosum]|nr:hypothetical protein BHM03_00015166 [Ensete ventricosum]